MAVEFREIAPPPDILSAAVSIPSQNTASIVFTTDSPSAQVGGSVSCVTQLLTLEPPSTLEPYLASPYTASIVLGQASLTIDKLAPATIHNIFCITISPESVRMSPEKAQETSRQLGGGVSFLNVAMECCKTIEVTVKQHIYKPEIVYSDEVTIFLPYTPVSSLTVALFANLNGTYAPTERNDFFLANQWRFSPSLQSVTVSLGLFAERLGTNSTPYGIYDLYTRIVGGAVEDLAAFGGYDALPVYPQAGGGKVEVVEPFAPIPPPTLISATFSDDGISLSVVFSGPTDRGAVQAQLESTNGLHHQLGQLSFSCNLLFVFRGADLATCRWLDQGSILITPDGLDEQKIGLNERIRLTERPGAERIKIRAACTAQTTLNCLKWDYLNSTSVNTTISDSINVPGIVVKAPDTVGLCMDINIDLSTSYGAGAREWQSVTVVPAIKTRSLYNATLFESLQVLQNIILTCTFPLLYFPLICILIDSLVSASFDVS
jgi:hypothetical protein